MAQYATENMRVDPLHEAMREHFERAAPRLDEQRLAELRLTFAFYQSQGLKFDRKIQDALSGKTMVERIPLVEGTRSNDFVVWHRSDICMGSFGECRDVTSLLYVGRKHMGLEMGIISCMRSR